MPKILKIVALAALLLPKGAAAAEWTFVADPAASEVHFSLGAVLHTVHGSAKVKSGEASWDAEKGTLSGKVVVDATSARTGITSRDDKMHKEVLESARFPEIVFTLEKFEGSFSPGRDGPLTVSGTFLLHGRSNPLTVPLTVTFSDGRVEASGAFKVPYVAWGLTDPSSFLLRVAKEVTVEVRIVGVAQPASSAPQR